METETTSEAEPARRDTAAQLKMLGSLLRLEALRPGGFTARELAAHAGVLGETARAFLNPDKRPEYTVQIAGQTAPSRLGSSGRPRKLYRVRPESKPELLKRVTELRQQLGPLLLEDSMTAAPADLFSPLQLLETTIEQLERRADSAEDWKERLAEARLELEGATAELRALQADRSVHAQDFALRLGAAQGRLAAEERLGPPAPITVDAPEFDPLRWLVDQFGSWIGEPPQWLKPEPVLVLFDGARYHTGLPASVLRSCQEEDVRVAAFDVATMAPDKRAVLYKTFDYLRSATPLCVSNLVLTLDGQTQQAMSLASEFRDLCQPGNWYARTGSTPPAIDLDALRRFYLMQSANILGMRYFGELDDRRKVFATRVTSALSAFAAADVARAAPRLPFDRPEQHRERWLVAAHELMGDVVCLDFGHNAAIKAAFDGSAVGYVATSHLDYVATSYLSAV